MPSAIASALVSRIESAIGTPDPTKVLAFLHEAEQAFVAAARQAVDSPEERRAIEDSVLGLYDKYAAPFLPGAFAKSTRDYFLKILDGALVVIGG